MTTFKHKINVDGNTKKYVLNVSIYKVKTANQFCCSVGEWSTYTYAIPDVPSFVYFQ